MEEECKSLAQALRSRLHDLTAEARLEVLAFTFGGYCMFCGEMQIGPTPCQCLEEE